VQIYLTVRGPHHDAVVRCALDAGPAPVDARNLHVPGATGGGVIGTICLCVCRQGLPHASAPPRKAHSAAHQPLLFLHSVYTAPPVHRKKTSAARPARRHLWIFPTLSFPLRLPPPRPKSSVLIVRWGRALWIHLPRFCRAAVCPRLWTWQLHLIATSATCKIVQRQAVCIVYTFRHLFSIIRGVCCGVRATARVCKHMRVHEFYATVRVCINPRDAQNMRALVYVSVLVQEVK